MEDTCNRRPPSRNKGRPSIEDAARIDRAILDAALEVMYRHGEAATLNEVARTAGLSRKSVYARYPGKSELFIGAIRQSLQGVGAVRYDASGDFADRLANFLVAVARMVSGPGAMRFQRLLSINPDFIVDLKPEMEEAGRRLIFEPLAALLADARDRGEIAVADVRAAAGIIGSAAVSLRMNSEVSPGLPTSALPPDDRLIDAQARQLTALLMQGLLPRE